MSFSIDVVLLALPMPCRDAAYRCLQRDLGALSITAKHIACVFLFRGRGGGLSTFFYDC